MDPAGEAAQVNGLDPHHATEVSALLGSKQKETNIHLE